MEEYQNGGTAKVLNMPKELKIKIIEGENMVKVKNVTGNQRFPEKNPITFKDDDGKLHTIKSGEEVECKYKRIMDERLEIVLETKKKKEKKEEVK